MSTRREQQQAFGFTNWGGKRRGAGRKPQGEQACVPHKTRAPLKRYEPVHVTVKLERGLPSLRGALAFRAVRRALVRGCERFGFRLVHWSIQSNHAHLIVEVEDKSALTRGMKGLCVRIAQALNALWRRSGRVFADRFHAHALKTPTEVRNALRYVLRNIEKHGLRFVDGFDPCSTGDVFDGWKNIRGASAQSSSVFGRARTWLLTKGWRKLGLIPLNGGPLPPEP